MEYNSDSDDNQGATPPRISNMQHDDSFVSSVGQNPASRDRASGTTQHAPTPSGLGIVIPIGIIVDEEPIDGALEATEIQPNIQLQSRSGTPISTTDLERSEPNRPTYSSTAAPDLGELVPAQEELETQEKRNLEQRFEERLQQELRASGEGVPQNNRVGIDARAVAVEYGTGQDSDQRNASRRGTRDSCNPGWTLLVLVGLIGIGIGVWFASGNDGNNQQPVETPAGVSLTPTTILPSQNPTFAPTQDQFSTCSKSLNPFWWKAQPSTIERISKVHQQLNIKYWIGSQIMKVDYLMAWKLTRRTPTFYSSGLLWVFCTIVGMEIHGGTNSTFSPRIPFVIGMVIHPISGAASNALLVP